MDLYFQRKRLNMLFMHRDLTVVKYIVACSFSLSTDPLYIGALNEFFHFQRLILTMEICWEN